MKNASFSSVDELGGAIAIDVDAQHERWDGDWEGRLYDTISPTLEEARVRFVPYHLWDNRAPGEMLVWVRAQG
jgi:DUF1680 family protein